MKNKPTKDAQTTSYFISLFAKKMFESLMNCTSLYSYGEKQLFSENETFDFSYYTVLLSVNSPPTHRSEISIPLNFVFDRELEMRKRGRDEYSYVMLQVQDWKMTKHIPHITRCGLLNEITVEVDIDIAPIYKSFDPEKPIDVLRRFYETGTLTISNELTCDEILYLKFVLDKLNLLIDCKCMRYDSFSSILSWSIWSTYLMIRDSIAQSISTQISIIQRTKQNQRIVAFLTSAEDKKVRYFVGDQECMIIDAISDRGNIDFAVSKRGKKFVLQDACSISYLFSLNFF